MWTMMISDSGAITGITLVHFPVRCQGGGMSEGGKGSVQLQNGEPIPFLSPGHVLQILNCIL